MQIRLFNKWRLPRRAKLGPLLMILAAWLALSCGAGEQRARDPRRTEDGRIHILYWEKWSGFELDAMQVIVDRYNASQDRIYVELVHMTDIRTKLLLATAGGNPPDVAGLFPDMMMKYSERGALMPLDQMMERDGISPDDYLPSVIALCHYRDFYWGLPTTPACSALFYNKRLFREAGLDPERPPRTIDELTEYADRLTRKDREGRIQQLGFTPMDPFFYKAWYGWWFGAEHWDGEDEITLNTREWIHCMRWIRGFPERHDRDALLRFQQGSGQLGSSQYLFLAEKTAMQHNGVWMVSFIQQYNSDMEWGAAPFPSISEELDDVTFVDTDILVIPKGARHPHEAWEFIKFVQKQENIEMLCMLHRKFSPLKEVSNNFYDKHENKYVGMFRHLAESPHARPVPMMPIVEELREELYVAVDKVWLQTETEERALNEAQVKMQRLLDRNLRQWNRVKERRIEEWAHAWENVEE